MTVISIESSGIQIEIEDDKNKTLPTPGMQDKHGNIFQIGENLDAWVSADYHFGKWMRKEGEEAEKLKAEEERIIELHNARVGKDDLFLFLGDISESEFGDEYRPEALEYAMKQIQRLNGRKILLTGNNDTCDNAYYKRCGFEEIFRRDRVITDKYVFSHFPVNMMNNDRINVHGHIHGSYVYWECNPENHIDAYWKLWDGPKRISELAQLYKDGAYVGHLEVSTKSEGNDTVL